MQEDRKPMKQDREDRGVMMADLGKKTTVGTDEKQKDDKSKSVDPFTTFSYLPKQQIQQLVDQGYTFSYIQLQNKQLIAIHHSGKKNETEVSAFIYNLWYASVMWGAEFLTESGNAPENGYGFTNKDSSYSVLIPDNADGRNSFQSCLLENTKNSDDVVDLWKTFQKIYKILPPPKPLFGKADNTEGDFYSELVEKTHSHVHIKKLFMTCSEQPNSRLATAWKLAAQHFKNCSIGNVRLLIQIHRFFYDQSPYGVRSSDYCDFYQAAEKGPLTATQIEQIRKLMIAMKPDSRMAVVSRELLAAEGRSSPSVLIRHL